MTLYLVILKVVKSNLWVDTGQQQFLVTKTGAFARATQLVPGSVVDGKSPESGIFLFLWAMTMTVFL